MRSSSVTKRSPSSPTGRKRGSTSGTFTRARRRWPVSGSRSITPSESERFEMYGNGRPGPTASGVRTGKMVPWNMAASSPRSDGRDLGHGHAPRRPPRAARPAAPPSTRALALDELAHPRAHAVEHLGGQQVARRARPVGRVAHGLEQLGHAHHAELVEVGREDGGEAQPLEQRDALVAGQLEHARVPLEPRELAVEEARLLRGLLRAADGHHAPPAISASARGRRNQRSSPRWPAMRLDRRRAGLGKRDARARDGVQEHREVGLVADEHEVRRRAARSSPARSSASTPSSAASSASGAPSSCAMISAVSCARGYGLVTTHCGSTFSAASARPVARAARRPAATSVRSGSGVPSARSSASACRTRMIATASA